MVWKTHLTIVLMVAISLAGCVGSDDPAPGGTQTTPTASADDETGGLEGVVVDDESVPLPDVTVAIAELDRTTKTAQGGAFAFSQLPPGRYQVFAQKLGHESTGVSASIQVGEVSSVTIQLPRLSVAEARQSTVIWNGYMKCSAGIWEVGWSEECGEGLGTPVGTFGKDPNNLVDWDFELLERPETILTETVWQPGTTAASGMRVVIVQNMACEPICEWDAKYADAETGPPVRLVAKGSSLPKDDASYPLALTVRHWASLGTGPTDPIHLITEQAFEVYKTEFFGVPMEDVNPDFSAVPPQ